MKVTLTSHSANHLLRLAQGLQAHDALNRFYTIYPQFKLTPYQIHKNYVYSFKTLAASTFLLRKIGWSMPEKLHSILFDRYTALMLRFDRNQSDVVQGNSGYCLETLRIAKKRGIQTIVDRACPHIDFQLALLDEEVERLTGGKNQASSQSALREKMLAEYEFSDHIIVPSTYSYRSFIQKGLTAEKLHIVPLMKEKNVTRAIEHDVKKDKPFTVFSAGFSFYRKGFYYLLKAWRELNLPNAKLIIRTTVPKIFLNLLDHPTIIAIHHHLPTTELIRLYQQCDVFCLPSVDEGFGMAVMEAMAAAKPIIVTEHVGMTDLITNKKEGFILPVRNIDAIKESILMLYEDRVRAKEMGEAAYLCEQQYSLEKYIQTIMATYQKLI